MAVFLYMYGNVGNWALGIKVSCNKINIVLLVITSICQGHPVQRHPLDSPQGTHLPPTLQHPPLRGPVALEGPMERGTK